MPTLKCWVDLARMCSVRCTQLPCLELGTYAAHERRSLIPATLKQGPTMRCTDNVADNYLAGHRWVDTGGWTRTFREHHESSARAVCYLDVHPGVEFLQQDHVRRTVHAAAAALRGAHLLVHDSAPLEQHDAFQYMHRRHEHGEGIKHQHSAQQASACWVASKHCRSYGLPTCSAAVLDLPSNMHRQRSLPRTCGCTTTEIVAKRVSSSNAAP